MKILLINKCKGIGVKSVGRALDMKAVSLAAWANVSVMALLDGFQKAYFVDLGSLNIVRAAAFYGAQYIAPLKRNII